MNYRHQKAIWPISFSELKERRDQCKKREAISSVIWLIILFAILLGNIPFAGRITELQKEAPWIGITYGVGFFSFLIGNLIITLRVINGRLRSFDLICPECNQLLNQQTMALAITTGRCSNCGSLLVKDHPERKAEPEP